MHLGSIYLVVNNFNKSIAIAPNTRKFVLNCWDENLRKEYECVKHLEITDNLTIIKYVCKSILLLSINGS